MSIIFNEKNHTYINEETNKNLISVTQLLEKHGISPSYENMKSNERLSAILKSKADIGKLIHSEIEEYVTNKKRGFTDEFESFLSLVERENITLINCEQIVSDEDVAGKYDLFVEYQKKLYILDVKTTTTLHTQSVRWQTSIYAYMKAKKEFGELIDYSKCIKVGAIHFENGEAKLITFDNIPQSNIERLFQCEKEGTLYKDNELISIANQELIIECEEKIVELENQIKMYEEQKKLIQQNLLEAVKQSGVNHHELGGGKLLITFIPESERESLDSSKLKTEMPEIYQKYLKKSKVKEQLRIKLRD